MNHRRQRESKSGDTCSFRDAIANIGILFLTLTLTLTLSLILTHITNPDGQNNSLTIAPLKVNASPKMFKWVDLRVQKGWGVGRVLGRGCELNFPLCNGLYRTDIVCHKVLLLAIATAAEYKLQSSQSDRVQIVRWKQSLDVDLFRSSIMRIQL